MAMACASWLRSATIVDSAIVYSWKAATSTQPSRNIASKDGEIAFIV